MQIVKIDCADVLFKTRFMVIFVSNSMYNVQHVYIMPTRQGHELEETTKIKVKL